DQDTCAAYMVIAPCGNQGFIATYHITDTLSHIERVHRQSFTLNPQPNTVYPVECNILESDFHTIDLGLSCNWANVNVNATDPGKKGPQYATSSDANAALLEKTVVTQWLIPDADQCQELIEKCQWQWGEYNGTMGYFVIGATTSKEFGKVLRIFLPSSSTTQVTPAECLAENWRPVETLMVDLGLSSGVKWAARNIGATAPEDYGNYYAWGEVEPKQSYTKGNYLYGTQNLGDNFDISSTLNDAATVVWGGLWRMPRVSEMVELCDNCTWQKKTINGVSGFLVTGPNGNNIFLPAGGYYKNSTLENRSNAGSYYTSTEGGDRSHYIYTLSWRYGWYDGTRCINGNSQYDPFNTGWDDPTFRYWGRNIRPVTSPNAIDKDGNVYNIHTDSVSWKTGQTEATLYGTLSSAKPIHGTVTVGFVVGDSAQIVKGTERFLLTKTTPVGGTYSLTIPVHDNIGYWYRAFIETNETIFYGDAKHFAYEFVDLGLPSGTMWANMNIGSDQPSDYGDYYAWGEVNTKQSYSKNNYQYGTTNIGVDFDISGTEYDVAHVKLGGIWRMPTRSQMQELMDYCTWRWTSKDGVNGYEITGSNGNSIFLPAGGYFKDSSVSNLLNAGSYYTSTEGGDRSSFAYTLSWRSYWYDGRRCLNGNSQYDPFNTGWDDPTNRWIGRNIRPVAQINALDKDGNMYIIHTDSAVWKVGQTQATLYETLSSLRPLQDAVTIGFVVGDSAQIVRGKSRYELSQQVTDGGSYSFTIPVHDNMGYWYRAFVETNDTILYGDAKHYGYEYVNLGLPSGTLWANMNVGSSDPSDYGDYFAWGEVSTKDIYTTDNYKYGDLNIGVDFDISGTEYDAAHINMGNAWCMPTRTQMAELMNNCTWKWTGHNGINGFEVTGPNGNSIFLPSGGYFKSSTICNLSDAGSYHTSTEGGDRSSYAYTLSWRSYWYDGRRCLNGDNQYDPFSTAWGDPTNRWIGRNVRAVYNPNAITSENVMNIHTDSATWNLSATEATIYGTISSSLPLAEGIKVGFVVGNSSRITKENATVYEMSTTNYGSFSQLVTGITDNIGYWYRAYVETADGDVFYGAARHFGWEMVDLGLPSGTLWSNVNVGGTIPTDYGNYYAWGEVTIKNEYSSGTSQYNYSNIGNDIAGTMFDAAFSTMGNLWCMPTKEQMAELINNCTWKWTGHNGVNGFEVTGSNGNSIFLPAAGYYKIDALLQRTNAGSYYTSTGGDDYNYAYTLCWRYDWNNGRRCLNGNYQYDPFSSGWGDPTYRYYGRSIRPVAVRKRQ
ncbi:MAG: hypothetical protein J6Z41_09070, partial [Prevotella sp.]|nr:hypothetical protein [Prevotella sp.]